MTTTDIKPNLNGDLVTRLNWADEFDGDLSDNWTDEFNSDNRTGNKYIQEDGSIDYNAPWHKLTGRWAALYDKYRDECQFIRYGQLVIKGHAVETPNPYRDNFEYNGETHRYGDFMLYAPWLEAKNRIYPGQVVEMRINLEKQVMRGFRSNLWGMPIDKKAYDDDIKEAEIDFPEVENPSRVSNSDFGNMALLKLVAGYAGDTPNGTVNLKKLGIDLRKGWHTFTLVWNLDGTLIWCVDGIEANRDDRSMTTPIFMYLAGEMNSGVKGADGAPWENREDGPKKPKDPGLTGQSVILDVDLIDEHETVIDYIRVWDIVEGKEETESKTDPVMQAFHDVRSAMDKLEGLLKSE